MDPATTAAVALGAELAATPGVPGWVVPLLTMLMLLLVPVFRAVERRLDDREPVKLLRELRDRVEHVDGKVDRLARVVEGHHEGAGDGPSLALLADK